MEYNDFLPSNKKKEVASQTSIGVVAPNLATGDDLPVIDLFKSPQLSEVATNKVGDNHITYVCITTPNLDKMKRNLPLIMTHVDSALLVLGRRDDDAEKYFSTWPMVKTVYREWDDSFKKQYQFGLDNVKGGWLLWLDDDEVPSEKMLQSLRTVVEQSANGEKFDTVSFPSCDVWDNKVGEFCDYHREMLTKWNPQLHFEIELHQCLVGKHRGIRAEHGYYHFKEQDGGFRGACRNFFTAGVWADHKESFEYWHKETGQDPRINEGAPLEPMNQSPPYPLKDGFRIDSWQEMKDILKAQHPDITDFLKLDKVLKEGGICQEFVDWAERHNEDNDKRPHLHEIHAFDKYLKYLKDKE